MKDWINTIQLGNAYEVLKDIPDKSIDLVVIDPPYEYTTGEGGGCFGSKNKKHHKEYYEIAKSGIDKSVLERKQQNRIDIKHISSGFNYAILDELDRVMKHIYIYMV